MSILKRLANGIPFSRSGRIDMESHESLDRATYIELFFDLVFIFCMHSILPIITNAKGGNADWYSYYTFWFTLTLMLQIWFNSTIFMNRFGTGRVPDIVFLFTNMFLLFVMTQAISTGWEHYAIYNICWVLIVINTIIHWAIRYRQIANPSEQIKRDTRSAIITLGIQVVLVLISHLMPSVPAQVVCLVAMLLGFAFWRSGSKDELDERGSGHMAERCALLMVLMFGETLIGFGREVSTDLHLYMPIMYFLLIVGMFLIYLNEIINLVDLSKLGGGRRFMALSAWLTFWIANVTAGFEMSARNISLMGMEGDVFFGISVLVFLLSFFLFSPFHKRKTLTRKLIIARSIACLLVLMQTSAAAVIAWRLLNQISVSPETVASMFSFLSSLTMAIAVAAVYAILFIDRIAVRRERKRAAAEKESSETA